MIRTVNFLTPRFFVAIFFVVLGVSLLSSSNAYADYCSPGGMGRGGCIGFFDGGNATSYSCHDGGSDVINVLPNGLHSNSATSFINTIKSNLGKSGSGRNQKGAAFIVHAVLGQHKSGGYDPYVGWARSNFTAFENKVKAYAKNKDGYGIHWNVSRTTSRNSAYFNSCAHDDAFHSTEYGGATADVIEFYAPGGKKLQIERACANLRGDVKLPNPPSANWSLKATTDSPATHANPVEAGVNVKWKHHLTNKGPDKTDASVDPHVVTVRVKNGNTTTLSNSNKANIDSGWAKNGTKDYNDSYTITSADEGSSVCQYLTASPGSDDGGSVTSTKVCVSVPKIVLACSKNATASGNDFWNIRAHIETMQEEVRLGGTMKWSHEIKNTGPDTTDLTINWGYGGTTSGGNWTASGVGNNGVRSKDTTHIATQDDVGKTYYRTTWADPSGRGWSAWSGWSTNSPRDLSTSTSGEPKNNDTHQYRRAYVKTQYKGDTYTRSQKKDGTYTAWKDVGDWGWSDSDESYWTATKKKSLSNTRKLYETQVRTRHKQAADKIETGGCGIYVPYDYVLVPSISPDKTRAEVDSQVTAQGTIHNNGPTKSEAVNWKITQIVYQKGVDTPSNTTPEIGDADACNVYGDDADTCSVKGSGSIAGVATDTDSSVSANSYIPVTDAGSHVCYVLSIHPWRNRYSTDGGHPGDGPDTWSHSVVGCVVVSRTPKIHVEDGDLKTRGAVVTSTSRIGSNGNGTNQKTYGSWVDYGVLSQGTNSLIASGGGLRGGYSPDSSTDWSQLTFANNPMAGGFTLGSFSSLYGYFKDLSGTATPGGSIVLNGTGNKVLQFNSDVTIDDSSINPGTTYIIQAPGHTVKITGNIKYTTNAPISSMKDIPQVVIVAENIKIENNSTRIDAWLLANNSVNTCSDDDAPPIGSPLTVDDCDNDLAINGPVATRHLYLRRTAGATAAEPESSAETIRLTPWTYLWLYSYARQGDNLRTTYITEQPPRF